MLGTISVHRKMWIALAVDTSYSRLVANTLPCTSPDKAEAQILSRLRKLKGSRRLKRMNTKGLIRIGWRLWQLFTGEGEPFTLNEISLKGWTSKRIRVARYLIRIPRGRVTTYGRVAMEVGSSPRGIGLVMASNPVPLAVPCHRVVYADGRIGGFMRGGREGTRLKARILRAEGVPLLDDEAVDPSAII